MRLFHLFTVALKNDQGQALAVRLPLVERGVVGGLAESNSIFPGDVLTSKEQTGISAG